MSGSDELQKYLQAIYDRANRKAVTEHRSVRSLKSAQDSSQTDITFNIDDISNEFGEWAGYIGYADTFDKTPLYSYGTFVDKRLLAHYAPDMPIVARPVSSGYTQSNLLINGGFESGFVSGSTVVLDGWTITTSGTFTSHSEIFSYSSKSEQSRSVEFNWNANTSASVTMYQDVKNIGRWGKYIRLEWDRYFVSRPNGFVDAKYQYDFYDAAGNAISYQNSGTAIDPTATIPGLGQTGALDSGFTTMADVITIPAQTYRMRISFIFNSSVAGAAQCRIDNVKLFAIDNITANLFFLTNSVGKENYVVGAVRSYDFFVRTPATTLGVSNDFRIWNATNWGTSQDANLINYLAYNTLSSQNIALQDVGKYTNISIVAEITWSSGLETGIVCKYTSPSNYISVTFHNTNGLRINSNGSVVAQGSVFSPPATNDRVLVVINLIGADIFAYVYCLGTMYSLSYTGDTHTGTSHGLISNNSTDHFNRYVIYDTFWKGSGNIKVSQNSLPGYAYSSSAGTTDVAYIDLAGPSTRIKYKANIKALPTGSDHAGITFRTIDTNNYWKLYVDTAGYHVVPVVSGIAGNDYCTDTKKPAEGNVYVYSDQSGFYIQTGDLYPEEVLADNPLGYWRLADTSGTTVINSATNANALSGTYPGSGITLNQTGALSTDPNTALQVTSTVGTNGTVADVEYLPTSTASRSLECWVKPTSAGALTQGGICGYPYNTAASGNNWFALDYNLITSNKRFVMDWGGATVNSVNTYAENNWYHIVMTYDGTTARLYVNGVQDTSSVVTLATASNGNATTNFNIMGCPNRSNQQRDCYIDEVAIYDTCLSAGRVAAHYNASKSQILLVNNGYRFDNTLFSTRTGFGIYIKGTSGRIANTFVQHLDFVANYKDFAFFDNHMRVS